MALVWGHPSSNVCTSQCWNILQLVAVCYLVWWQAYNHRKSKVTSQHEAIFSCQESTQKLCLQHQGQICHQLKKSISQMLQQLCWYIYRVSGSCFQILAVGVCSLLSISWFSVVMHPDFFSLFQPRTYQAASLATKAEVFFFFFFFFFLLYFF